MIVAVVGQVSRIRYLAGTRGLGAAGGWQPEMGKMYPKEQQDLCSGDCNYCRICNNSEVDVGRRSALARGQVGIRSICVFVDCVGLRGAGFVGNWRFGGTRNLCSDVQGIPHPRAAGGGEVRSQCGGAGAGRSGITLPGHSWQL